MNGNCNNATTLQVSKTKPDAFLYIFVLQYYLSARKFLSQAVEDRTFCIANAATTCANSCAGVVTKSFSYYFGKKVKRSSHNLFSLHQSCTETCTVVCGFWYLYRRICSNVILPLFLFISCGFWYLYRRICSNVILPPVFFHFLSHACTIVHLMRILVPLLSHLFQFNFTPSVFTFSHIHVCLMQVASSTCTTTTAAATTAGR